MVTQSISILRNKFQSLTKDERKLLEIALLGQICAELREFFRHQHSNYFKSIGLPKELENTMLERDFVRLLINDILSTEEYTLEGIAYYINTHADVVYEVFTGINKDPSSSFLRKVIELHRTVRNDLYNTIIQKMLMQ